MKNIKSQLFGESIISNTAGIGMRPQIEEWAKKAFFYTSNYNINDDNSVDILIKCALLNRQFANVPTKINDCNELEVESDEVKKFRIPTSSNKVFIHDCKNLETLVIDENTICGELVIRNCPKLNFSAETFGLLKSHVKRLIIERCGITTIKCIGNIINYVYIGDCMKLKSFDADQLQTEYFELDNVKIKDIYIKTQIKDFNIHDCNMLNSVSIENASRDFKFFVYACSKLTDVTICNDAKEVTISKCSNIKNISVKNCTDSLCIDGVDAEYDIPDTITGVCVFKNCKNVPKEIKCKKLLMKG